MGRCVCGGGGGGGDGGGGGGGGADCPITKTCLTMSTHAFKSNLKWTSASALVPSAGLTSRKKETYVCSLRRQVPGIPSANLTQPQGEEKGCEARRPHLQGGAIFSISSVLNALDLDH